MLKCMTLNEKFSSLKILTGIQFNFFVVGLHDEYSSLCSNSNLNYLSAIAKCTQHFCLMFGYIFED